MTDARPWAAAALLVLATLPLAEAAPYDPAARAAEWFHAQVRPDGALSRYGDADWTTGPDAMAYAAAYEAAWVAVGLQPLGRSLAEYRGDRGDALAWWRANAAHGEDDAGNNPCGDRARTVLGVVAASEDPRAFGGRDWVAAMLECHRGEGKWDHPTRRDDGFTNHPVFALLALRAVGHAADDPVVVATVDAMLARQNADGGWDYRGAPQSAVDDTAQHIVALRTVLPADHVALQRGLARLAAVQMPDGGFVYSGTSESADSAAAVLEAVVAAGEDPTAGRWRKPHGDVRTNLLSFQTPSGGFRASRGAAGEDEHATWEAMRVLAGGVLPVVPPKVALSASPAVAGRPVEVAATVDLPVGRVVRWSWSVDGAPPVEGGPRTTHAFASPGRHSVVLDVVTDHGGRGRATLLVDVAAAPRLAVDVPDRAFRGETVVADVAGAPAFTIDWGDGNLTRGVASHAYARLGVYTVRVETPDAVATRDIAVVNAPPSLAAPATLVADRASPVELVAEAHDADGPAPRVTWRFGERVIEGPRAVLRPTTLGDLEGTVEAVDADGAVARAEVRIRVENLPPTLALHAPDAVEGERASVEAAASDPDGPAPRIVWSDGLEGPTHDVDTSTSGERTFTARAVDADGGVAEASVVVAVRAAGTPPRTGAPLAAGAEPASPPRHGEPATLALAAAGGAPPYAWRVQVGGADVPVVDGRAELGLLDRPLAWTAWVRDADRAVRSLGGVVKPPPNEPPVARLTVAGQRLGAVADAGASVDPEGRALLYRFRWGDGDVSAWSTSARAEHAYAAAGAYTVTVEVRDAVDALARASAPALALAAAAPAEEITSSAAPEAAPAALALGPHEATPPRETPAGWGALLALLGAALRRRGLGA